MAETTSNVFIIAGMPRCATTFLYHNLDRHPSIFASVRKETNYFSTNYGKGFAWYQSLYREMGARMIGADISPSYFIHDRAIERIKAFNPEVKVVLGVRDPAGWAVSVYSHVAAFSYGMPGFEEFLCGSPIRLGKEEFRIDLREGFISRRIEEYRQAFGRNLLLYDFGLFSKDPLRVLKAIESFLSIPDYFRKDNFDDSVIHAANRRSIKLLNYLMRQEGLVSFVEEFFPRRLLVTLRKAFDRASSRGKSDGNDLSEKALAFAKGLLGGECDVIRRLFSESELQLGTGEPFKGERP